MVKKIQTEDAVKRALNIDSFRKLSKDKVIEFISLLPQMDREVAISIINQFPKYSSTVSEMVNQLKDVCDRIIKGNDSNMEAVIGAYQSILDDLGSLLKKEYLSAEDRDSITFQMICVADKIAAKDTENKQFLQAIGKYAVITVIGIASVLATVLGVNYKSTQLPSVDR